MLRSAAVGEASAADENTANRLAGCGRAAAGRDDTAALPIKMRIAEQQSADASESDWSDYEGNGDADRYA